MPPTPLAITAKKLARFDVDVRKNVYFDYVNRSD